MPSKPQHACSFPHCVARVADGYYCPEHKTTSDQYRGSSAERGYDGDWRKFRLWFIERHPFCFDCKIVATKDVHHVLKLVEYPALRLVESNCLGLCHDCHAVRTGRGE